MQRVNQEIDADTIPDSRQRPVFREEGVYLISGGAGGLGRHVARYIGDQVKATIILCGRRAADQPDLATDGVTGRQQARLIYRQNDLTDLDATRDLLRGVGQQYGQINGVFHSAGLTRDSWLIRKQRREFDEVLAPKVTGTLNLDQALHEAGIDPDFFVLFSSISAVTGNGGQTDYAWANGFMDHFSVYRNRMQAEGLRRGPCLSINWPLWKDGGMSVDARTIERIRESFGFEPLETDAGLLAVHHLLAMGETPVTVVSGDGERIRQALHAIPEPEGEAVPSDVLPSENTDAIQATLMTIFARLLKVDAEELDPGTDLLDYGVDSIMMMKVLDELEEAFATTVDPDTLSTTTNIAGLAAQLNILPVAAPDTPTGTPVVAAAPANADSTPSPGRMTSLQDRRPGPQQAGAAEEEIAVIAMNCRFPGSPDPRRFWDNLRAGRDLLTDMGQDRFDMERWYDPAGGPGRSTTKRAGLIQGIDLFDAGAFGIDPGDALVMDPQHRILLEMTTHLFEEAGLAPAAVRGSRTGIWMGATESSYVRDRIGRMNDSHLKHLVVNMIQNMMSARISDHFDLRGLSWTVDTACSSALVAITQAAAALARGEVDMAIAGGIELILNHLTHVGFSKAGVLSAEPVSRVFDENASGFLPGEGAGLVLLKPLSRAIEDGDPVLATIAAAAINNDGRTIGLTVPNIEGQKAVIRTALQQGAINPENIGLFEAHGTGTLLGDPIEVKAASTVYREFSRNTSWCGIGSVKSNMGHALRAGGAASFIKAVLAIQHKTLPPTLHCRRPHPRFHFDKSPFFPITSPQPWDGEDRLAAVSSFGFGGTNCHMVLREFSDQRPSERVRRPLPRTTFNRQRFWLGPPDRDLAAVAPAQGPDWYEARLQCIEDGSLSPDDFIEELSQRRKQEEDVS